jgi:hypothetical protein
MTGGAVSLDSLDDLPEMYSSMKPYLYALRDADE